MLRRAGRRPCEITSLVCAEKDVRRGVEITRHLFKLAYLAARRLEGATDLLITVNPRHVRFYRRVLLMETLGAERPYENVDGAPAVLLGLDLLEAKPLYRRHYGDGEESLFRFFIDPGTESAVVGMLAAQRRKLDTDAFQRYFQIERPLLAEASPASRDYLESRYSHSRRSLVSEQKS